MLAPDAALPRDSKTRGSTLFLTMPIAWRGTLARYVGRLHRQHVGMAGVRVIDYVDSEVLVLSRMAVKRRAGFRALGYRSRSSAERSATSVTRTPRG